MKEFFLFTMFVLPSIIAYMRSHQSFIAIVAVNLIFGWTGLGWLWAFIWSLSGTKTVVVVREEREVK